MVSIRRRISAGHFGDRPDRVAFGPCFPHCNVATEVTAIPGNLDAGSSAGVLAQRFLSRSGASALGN